MIRKFTCGRISSNGMVAIMERRTRYMEIIVLGQFALLVFLH